MLIIYSLRQAQFFGIFTLLKLHVQFQPQLQPPLWRFKRKFQREVGTMQESFSCQQTVNRSRSNLIVKNAVNIVIQKCSFTYIWKQVSIFGDLVQPLRTTQKLPPVGLRGSGLFQFRRLISKDNQVLLWPQYKA